MADSTSSKMDDNTSSVSSKTTDISCLKPKSFRIPSHSESILDVLNKQRQNGEYCDVSVLVEHQRFTAHKCVLAANSPYFHSVLSNENDGMFLKQVGVDGFSVLLDFMYTSRLRLDPGNIQSVLSAAKVLQVNAAISICCRYLENQLKALTKDLNGNITNRPNEVPNNKFEGHQYNPPALMPAHQHQRRNLSPSYAGESMPPPVPVNRNYFAKRPDRYHDGSVASRSDIYNSNPYQHPKYRSDNEASYTEHRPNDNHPHQHGNPAAHNQHPRAKQRFYNNQNPNYGPPPDRIPEPKHGIPDKRYPPNNQMIRPKEPMHVRQRADREPSEQRTLWTRDYHPNHGTVNSSPHPKGDLWDRRREENLLLTRHCSREYQPEYKNTRKTKPYYPKYQQRIT